MRTLIVPCAGSRKIDNLPLYLNFHPDNKLLALKAIEGVYPKNYDKIIFTILKDVENDFQAKDKIIAANNSEYNIDFVILDEPTSGPAETVYETIKKAGIEGRFAVRDSHAFLRVKKDYDGNFVAGLDLTKYEKNGINIYVKRPLGQAVKTPPSQGGIMGSIPVGVTKTFNKRTLCLLSSLGHQT